jgi:hypothetical protein
VRPDPTDRFELRDLVDRYAIAADRCDGAGVAALFEPGGALVLHRDGEDRPATSRVEGHAALERAIGSLSRYETTTHFVGQQLVDVVGDEATGVTYCLAHHVGEGGDRTAVKIDSIRYLDRYRRHPDGWRFLERRLSFDWTEIRTVVARPVGS